MFTARYGLDPYIKQIRLDFKGLLGVAIYGNRNVVKKESEKIKKYRDLNGSNTACVECKNRSDTSNNRGN